VAYRAGGEQTLTPGFEISLASLGLHLPQLVAVRLHVGGRLGQEEVERQATLVGQAFHPRMRRTKTPRPVECDAPARAVH
jgi:hypothetical protein